MATCSAMRLNTLLCQAAERTIQNLVALEHTVLHLVALWVGSVCSAAWFIFRCAHKSALQLPGSSFFVLASLLLLCAC